MAVSIVRNEMVRMIIKLRHYLLPVKESFRASLPVITGPDLVYHK